MQEPAFLTLEEIKLIHENQIQFYGGSLGIRDESALLSALEAPRWAYQYGQCDWVELAAIYFYHPMENWSSSPFRWLPANWREKKSLRVCVPT